MKPPQPVSPDRGNAIAAIYEGARHQADAAVAVGRLKIAAHTLLYQNPDFKQLLADLVASAPAAPHGAGETFH